MIGAAEILNPRPTFVHPMMYGKPAYNRGSDEFSCGSCGGSSCCAPAAPRGTGGGSAVRCGVRAHRGKLVAVCGAVADARSERAGLSGRRLLGFTHLQRNSFVCN